MKNYTLVGFFLLLMFLNSLAFGHDRREIQVHLFEAHPNLRQVYLEAPFFLESPLHQKFSEGSYVIEIQGSGLVLRGTRHHTLYLPQPRLVLKAVKRLGIGLSSTMFRYYSGQVTVTINPDRTLALVNTTPIRDYVMSVVGSETLPNWPEEALKVQAVLTQTRLLTLSPHRMMGDSTQQEAFLGVARIRPEIRRAVQSVWGQTLMFQAHPIQVYYHATCGGKTSDGSYFTGKLSPPYLLSKRCRYCKVSPFFQNTQHLIPKRVFEQVFGQADPKVLQLDMAQRPIRIQLGNHQIISGYGFWLKLGQHLGWDKAPGTQYGIMVRRDGDILLTSRGAGHGVGLCQWGAAEMARQGKSYQAILDYYFPRTQINRRRFD